MATTSAGIGLYSLLFFGAHLVAGAPFNPSWPSNASGGSWPAQPSGGNWPSHPSGGAPPSGLETGWITTTVYSTITAPDRPATSTMSPNSSPISFATTTYSSAPTTTSTLATDVSSIAVTSSSTSASPSQTTTTAPVAPGTMRLSFVNNLETDPVYAYVTGTDSSGQLVMLTQTGEFYYPTGSGDVPVPISSSANVALSLNGYKQTTQLLIPNYISSARLWVSHKVPLNFSVTTTGLVEPSAVNDQDPNHNTNWGFIEFTFNSAEDGGLYTNLSFVDFLGLPLGMTVSSSNTTQKVLGPHKLATAEVCHRLKAQAAIDGQPWDQLCKNDTAGNLIRVVSPQTLVTQNASAFESYFDSYVDAVWAQYAITPLVIETQSASGTINCTSSGASLLCTGDDTPFTKPSAGDIFGCASGPFANAGNAVHLAAVPRVCAAFNRATLHLPGGNIQPYLPPSHYYAPPATNFYSRFVHDAEIDGKGYAFAYDDVSPDMEVYNTAGLIAEPTPLELRVFVGGYEKGLDE